MTAGAQPHGAPRRRKAQPHYTPADLEAQAQAVIDRFPERKRYVQDVRHWWHAHAADTLVVWYVLRDMQREDWEPPEEWGA